MYKRIEVYKCACMQIFKCVWEYTNMQESKYDGLLKVSKQQPFGVWKLSGGWLTERCLKGVWKISGRCFEYVWKMSLSCLKVSESV